MYFFNYILGYRDFSKLEEIKENIFKKYNQINDENIHKATEILLFESSRQKTWLLITEERFFCVLDDVENDFFRVRWNITKNDIIHGNQLIIKLKTYDYLKNTGKIDFGKFHKGWLYSKSIYSTHEELKSKIESEIIFKMCPIT